MATVDIEMKSSTGSRSMEFAQRQERALGGALVVVTMTGFQSKSHSHCCIQDGQSSVTQITQADHTY